MKGIIRLGVTLFLVCAIAAGGLSFVADFTAKPIAEQARREQQDALKLVAPRASEFTEVANGRWEATAAGASVGRVVAVKAKGYSGPIALAIGIDPEGKVSGVRVLSQTETPGLGAKVASLSFLSQFVGKAGAALALRKDDAAAGGVDAVAAATISSRAVSRAVRAAVEGN